MAEGNETVVGSISAASSGTIATATATANINDNEQSVWSVAATTATVNEGAGSITYTVSRTGATGAATISFATSGGSASAGSDYTAVNQTLSFAVGETSKTVTVAVANDTVAEINETVTGSISAASNGTISGSVATGTILDNDQSSWTVAASTGTVDEGAGFIAYTVSRTGASGAATISFVTGGGSAVAGSDYTPVNQLLSFAAGEMSKTVLVAVADDSLLEVTDTLVGSILGASSGNLLTGSATASIIDNDQTTWSVGAASSVVDEGGVFMAYTVSRTGGSGAAATIDFATSGGTATSGSDFTAVNQTLSFAAGEMSKTVLVAVSDDSLAEGPETVIGTITNPSFGNLATNSTGITITDNEQSNWTVAAVAGTVNENSGFAVYTVSRTGASDAATIDFVTSSVQSGSAVAATAGVDYTALSQTLSFAAGEFSKTVRVALINDEVPEPNKSLRAEIQNASSGTLVTAAANTVLDDDDQSQWRVTSVGGMSESSGTIVFTVNRVGATSSATVDLVFTGSATNGVDYIAPASQTLSFAEGEMLKTVSVNLLNDTVPEGDETIIGALVNISQGTLADNMRGVTLVDDDSAVWSVGASGALEGGSLVFTVTRTGDTSSAAVINFDTSGGTAMAGADYTAVSQVLSFAAGETSKTVLVAVASDALAESNETVIGAITSPSLGSIATGVATATITDNNQSSWTLSVLSGGDIESAGYGSWVISRTGPLAAATIDFATVGTVSAGDASIAISGLDYTPVAQTLAFAAGESSKTVRVAIVNDNLAEQGELVSASISNASTGVIATNGSVGFVITDDEAVAVFELSVSSVTEGGTVIVSIYRNNAAASQVATVDLITTGTGTAKPGTDYTFATRTLSFAQGELMKFVEVSTVGDALVEANETITFALANASTGAIIGSQSSTATITDDDGLMAWSIAAPVGTVDESAGYVTVSVTRNVANSAAAIDVSTLGGTVVAGVGKDYAALQQTLNFAVGEFSKTVRLQVHDDSLIEGNKTVTLGISNASAGSIASASTTVTLTDDDVSSWTVAGTGSFFEGVGAGMTFAVRRVGDLGAATIEVASLNNNASIVPGIDFTPVRQTLNFAAGESVKLVTIPILEDALPEAVVFNALGLVIANPSVGRIVTAYANEAHFSSDETRTLFSASGGGASTDDVSAARFTITRSGDISGSDTIDYNVVGTGGATAGTDFTATSGTLTFVAGQRTAFISVPLIEDTVVDTGKGLSLTLQNASSGAITTPTSTVSLTDNDAAATGTVSYSVTQTTNNVFESAGTAAFTITRSGDVSVASTSYFRANSSSGGTATDGSDYIGRSTTLNWAAGETAKVVSVALVDDSTAEASKTIIGQIATDAGFTTALGSSTLTLLDDDSAGTGTNTYSVAVTSAASRITESNGTLAFTVTRGGDLTVVGSSYFRTNGGTAATDGSDYTPITSQTLNWAIGETTKVVLVALNNDSVSEASETIIGQVASDAAFTTGLANVTASVFDDDLYTAANGVVDTITYGTSGGAYTGALRLDLGDMDDTVNLNTAAGGGMGLIALASGNDTLSVSNPSNLLGQVRSDGGSGVDTLAYSGTTAFDHASVTADSYITGFEIIDLSTATTNQTVRLSLADVLEITRGNAVADTLRIMGNAVSGDVLNLQALGKTFSTPAAGASITDVDGASYVVAASAAGNASANDVTIGAKTYDVYQYAFDSHLINLLVNTTITTNVI